MGTIGTSQDIFIILLMILFMGNQAADSGNNWSNTGSSLSSINEMILIMILLFTLSGSNNNNGIGSCCSRNGMNCRTT